MFQIELLRREVNFLSEGVCRKDLVTFSDIYRGADKSLARPGRQQATVTDGFDVRISYL